MKRRRPYVDCEQSNVERSSPMGKCDDYDASVSNNNELRQQYTAIVDGLFTKIFSLKQNKSTTIKKLDEIKLELRELEAALNHVKSRIPSDRLKEWRLHTKRTHPMRPFASYLSQKYDLQCCSQAFCKFYEILTRFPDLCEANVDELRSLHLCEAPGAFISALNVYLQLKKPNLKWLWKANSLNPHYEWNRASDMFLDDELLTSTHCNWLFGEDNSGDILKWSEHYLKDIVTNERCFHLITADGSIYCQDNPSNQELVTYSLLQAEIKTSLSLLEAGGSFVLKMYTMFREETATTVAQLMSHFEDVHLFKPSSSKPGNSEVYLVCRGYIPKGLNDECTPISTDIEWMNILECCQFFFTRQAQAIEFNVASFDIGRRQVEEIVKEGKKCAQETFKREMNTANFERFTQQMWLKSYASNDAYIRTENPWRFDKANDVVERLRNITYEGAIRAIEQMLLDGCLSDQLGKEESRIQAEICLECDGCKWLDLMEQGKMNELATTFGLPSSSDGEFADIRHSLFVDVSMIPLAEATKTHLFDLCESSFTIGNKARNMRDFIVSDGCSMEVHCDRMTQQDWLDVLMQICHSRIDRDAVAKTALSIKSNRPMLILSRFAASIIVYLSMLFSQVSLLAPVAFNEHVGEIICCRQPNTNFHNYEFFSKYLSEISENLRKTDQLLMSFVPLCQLACEKLYSNIRLFNTACVMQIFSRIYANYANTKCHEDDNRHKRDDPFVQLKLTEKLAADAFS